MSESNKIVKSGIQELDDWAQNIMDVKDTCSGYPVNFTQNFDELNNWIRVNKLDDLIMLNVGDPFAEKHYYTMNTFQFEKAVIEYFAPKYGFAEGDFWGIVTYSGTDGNAHGMYFGYKYLLKESNGLKPIAYISDEAHYSNLRLTDVQNIEVRLIKSDTEGRMIPEELEKSLDTSRPALVVFAMGSTFKGAIDDIDALNEVLDKHPEMPVYRHIDAALFGGYLPFTEYKDMMNRQLHRYDSIAISGHKFFGIKSPSGFFITSKEVFDNQPDINVAYLKSDMKMINCSRQSFPALYFWWMIKHDGERIWTESAQKILEITQYTIDRLNEIGYPSFVNRLSNTVVLKHPGKFMVRKYMLINSSDDRLGGKLSHFIVMQHMDRSYIDQFICDLKEYSMI